MMGFTVVGKPAAAEIASSPLNGFFFREGEHKVLNAIKLAEEPN